MNVSKHKWSAVKLGWIASIAACTTVAVIFTFVGNFSLLDKTFIIVIAYIQLIANTLHHSPVHRKGDMIQGMIYGDCGDDSVCTTVRSWVMQWYLSVLCFSGLCTGLFVLMISR